VGKALAKSHTLSKHVEAKCLCNRTRVRTPASPFFTGMEWFFRILNKLRHWFRGFLLLEPTSFDKPKVKIDLVDSDVSGLHYYQFSESLGLRLGDLLILTREPTNEFDARAIQVSTSNHEKLGYLPKLENHIPTLLADQGVELIGEIIELSYQPKKLRLKMYQLI
jgi:hypothetical protein